ncbi:hypothetical protein [Halorubrum amylolyticum]|uniref:hypothetical protein n=1 Tax=Halorubrum amylolyticum TaxID=2508724 RepID=UPI00100919B5|nr:hypothetical protein [Halorubrum amylolyticum]
MHKLVVSVEKLADRRFATVGESNRVVLTATVDGDEATIFEIEDIPADGSRLDVDCVIVFEIPVATAMGGSEVAEESPFPRRCGEAIECRPRRVCVCGRFLVATAGATTTGPIPVVSKIEVDRTPPWVATRQLTLECRRRDDAHVEAVAEDGDRRERANARPAIGEIRPRLSVE